MDAKLDIFRRLPDGQPIWITAVRGLEEARRLLTEMARSAPGEYFIFDTSNGRVIPG